MNRDGSNSRRRHSLRLRRFDYGHPGSYFVTICTYQRQCLFGRIVDGRMQVSEAGQHVLNSWHALPDHFTGVERDEYVLMPNHIHGVVRIVDLGGARHASPLRQGVALGVVIGAFKSAAARRIRSAVGADVQRIWQRGYYEHVIRSERSLQAIREYIRNNPMQWALDGENPDFAGY